MQAEPQQSGMQIQLCAADDKREPKHDEMLPTQRFKPVREDSGICEESGGGSHLIAQSRRLEREEMPLLVVGGELCASAYGVGG